MPGWGSEATTLTGAVPPELGNLHNLDTLSLDNNELTGPLPLSLARLERLDGFSYFNSGLCVPDDGSFRALAWNTFASIGARVWTASRATGTPPDVPLLVSESRAFFRHGRSADGHRQQTAMDPGQE